MRRQQQLHTALLIHPSLVALRDFLIH
jgi:hypothetical protein